MHEEAKNWIDEDGYFYPIQLFAGFGCAAFGEDDVGLRLNYFDSAASAEVKTIRVKLTAEFALQLSAQLRHYADQPRPRKPGQKKPR